MIDYEALAVRSFDHLLSGDERAALRVWADALEARGDPRGALIAIEHALHAQPERRIELRQAMRAHAQAHAAVLFDGLEDLLGFRRAVDLDWCAGLVYGVRFDARHVADRTKLGDAARHVGRLLASPALARLRRLDVRVRSERDLEPVLDLLGTGEPRHPLEEIVVITGVRPTRVIAERRLGSSTVRVVERYPGLRLFAAHDYRYDQLLVLPLTLGRPQATDAAIASAAAAAEPETAEGRAALGRALVHPTPALRAAALRRLDELGARGFALVETLMVLLGPGVVTPQAPIAEGLAAIGEPARIALPLLATITGRRAHYDADTRRAAGAAIAALRGAPP